MRDAMRIPRTRGALTGSLLVLLGVWGAIVPFIAPYFGYGLAGPGGPVSASDPWTFTWARLYLDILPGAAAFFGGLTLLGGHHRVPTSFGAWLAAVGGIWFVVGPQISRLWNAIDGGAGIGSGTVPVAPALVWFYGLGALVILLGGIAIGRLAVRGIRDAGPIEPEPEADPGGAEGRHVRAA